jgi:hypothetical protein
MQIEKATAAAAANGELQGKTGVLRRHSKKHDRRCRRHKF